MTTNCYFLTAGSEFFSWNSGENTPNILKELSERIGALRETMKQASNSSDKLARALNRFTLALVIVGAAALVLQAVSLGLTFWARYHP